jgi:RHS repeat-associated protein
MGVYTALYDADETLHPWSTNKSGPSHTIDGTMIDYNMTWGTGTGYANYPNGKTVLYGAQSGKDLNTTQYPVSIQDANGNIIKISYVNNVGPAIDMIQDTLGRVISFFYDANNLLTAITAPGLGSTTRTGVRRTVVRFHYSALNLVSPSATYQVSPSQGIDTIYFPGTSTGYWFGAPDSYGGDSGIITKVSQRRAMIFREGARFNDQGTITPGTMTRDRLYGYNPALPTATAAGKPIPSTYSTLTETWAGMDTPPAVTTYTVDTYGFPRRTDTVYPDGTKVTQLMYNHQGKYDDELPYQTTTYDSAGNQLRQVVTAWEPGDYDSPRVTSTEVTDQLDQTTKTANSYGLSTNQLTDVTQYDYDGATVLRHTHTDYETNPGYANRHIFNLPTSVTVDGAAGRASRTDYQYDQQQLADAPGVAGYSDPATDFRGNITQVTRYANANAVTPANAVIESRRYDITGNLLTASGAMNEQTAITYDPGTQYAYPSTVTSGAAAPASPARMTQSFIYDFGTGLLLTSTDVNGRTTKKTYDAASLRIQLVTIPTGAYTKSSYDDVAMSVVQTSFTAAGRIAATTVTWRNGLGLNQRTESMSDGGPSAVATQYDALGRVWKTSVPYSPIPPPPPGTLAWTTLSRDALGRVTSAQNPDGSQTTWYHNEQKRPSSASTDKGETVRVQSPAIPWQGTEVSGADRWYRTDALGLLAEVVEPNAYGPWQIGGKPIFVPGGSVFNPGNVKTSYTYNGLGLLAQVAQGANGPRRSFQYDSLGRLTAQHLPEKSATLDKTGAYVGVGGQWSDFFTYDNRSNLISRTDARGVKTLYDYGADPLNRLHRVSYQFIGPADPSIRLTAPVDYAYMVTGDITRINKITTSPLPSNLAVQEFAYDTEGRLASSKLTWSTPRAALPALQLDYAYDTLSRLIEETYPTEIGAAGRKKVDYTYGLNGQLTSLQVDGADYASQFSYNTAGQADSITIGPAGPQQTVETYAYDPATNLLASQQVQRGNTVLLDLAYSYWPNTQLAQIVQDNGNRQFSYLYDALDRVWKMIKLDGPDGPEWSEEYTFDEFGNRIAVQAAGQFDGGPAPVDGLPALTYDPATNHATTAGFSYDAAGNQTRAQRPDGSGLRYLYDQAGHLASVADDNGRPLEAYGYGADGKLLITSHAPTNTYYFWNRNRLIAEYTQRGNQADFTWSRSRVYLGNRTLASFTPGQPEQLVYYHHPDRLGTRLITNNQDNATSEQTTLPFGTLLTAAATAVNPVFTSYDHNFTTGLDYAINRYYDPTLRFTQPDPAGITAVNLKNPQSLNLYTYINNDPLNGIDPDGLQGDQDWGAPGQQNIWFGQVNPWAIPDALVAIATGLGKGGWIGLLGAGIGFYKLGQAIPGLQSTMPDAYMDPMVNPLFVALGTMGYVPYQDSSGISYISAPIGVTTSINGTFESSSGNDWTTWITVQGSDGPQTTTISATNNMDGTSQVTMIFPDQSGLVRKTAADGSFTQTPINPDGTEGPTTKYNANGDEVSSGTDGGMSTDAETPQPSPD